jgi:hypothetical protein
MSWKYRAITDEFGYFLVQPETFIKPGKVIKFTVWVPNYVIYHDQMTSYQVPGAFNNPHKVLIKLRKLTNVSGE